MLLLCGAGRRGGLVSHRGLTLETRTTYEVSAPRKHCLIANKKGQIRSVSQRREPERTRGTELRLPMVHPFPLGKKECFS